MPKSMVDFTWEVGTFFAEKQDILDAVKGYALENGRNIKFVKNDKRRLRMKCFGAKGECPWTIYFGYMEAVKSWQLRTKKDIHTCSREFNLKLVDAKWLSKKLVKTVQENPKMKGVDIREKVQRKWNIGISRSMAYRAKAIASNEIDGSFNEQYKRIYDYAHELLERNPGSTVKVHVENNEGELIFKRFYCCLKACKDSFVCCRPIIGLDGAFLKGKYGGELLTAVGRDGNDQMLPIAYAVVEVENKDSWMWFLELLIDDLGGGEVCSSITFVSDQQKGLLPAIQQLLPGVDQRFCVRHLYSNFRKKFPGKNLKQLMWRAATATHPQNWEREMRNIKDINEDAFKHSIAIPPRYWSRSRFSPTPKCDTLVNNISEAFNSVLVHTRTKPIITMLEEIRVYIMQRWAKNRSKIQSFSGPICPKIQARFTKESQATKNWIPRRWSITGIPCCHSLAAMKFLNIDGQQFIPACFLKSTYEETYASIVYPINGNNMWDLTPYPDVMPPRKKVMSGRPKRKRRLEQWEIRKDDSRVSKGGLRKRCGICREVGHNRSRCPKATEEPIMPSSQLSEVCMNDEEAEL
ncbi:uncharacterized protein LOC108320266 [Vigna angularis]|uniref:uncharacterized protein LOC108320266 n=1 Tax=Phaseolus angularis TaxID=3914 RepID=UPI0022B30EAB|nr:uncharacterized protein LOC108320266 [Vigna angularis]